MSLKDMVPFRHRRAEVSSDPATNPFARFHAEIDRMFEDFFTPGFTRNGLHEGLLPSIDVSETDETVEVKADLPGIDQKDINVTLRDGALYIMGERKAESEKKDKNYIPNSKHYMLDN